MARALAALRQGHGRRRIWHLGRAAEEGIFSPGDKIIFCSVGAGLTFTGGLLVW
jgi:3-oxoacyl-[acyl-carrier-protein] synthase III